jgi:paraquat-inducible protein A
MTETTPARPLKACPTCGLVQDVPDTSPGCVARCPRCEAIVVHGSRTSRGNSPALAAALAALFLYPVAILMPVLRLERFGRESDASIWSGSIGLLRDGEIFVGGVVLLCSVVVPLVKLLGLVTLCTSARFSQRHRAHFYRGVEIAGRWGMLDVLLIAVVVAWVKIGDLVEVSAGPAALAFTLCVLLSLVASAYFDPHAIWEEDARIKGGAR